MTAQEKTIALEAISRKHAETLEVIREEVSLTTGVNVIEVRETLARLVNDRFLKECIIPAHNVAANPEPLPEITWAWYEKGELWKDA
jgi:hypothetical protein